MCDSILEVIGNRNVLKQNQRLTWLATPGSVTPMSVSADGSASHRTLTPAPTAERRDACVAALPTTRRAGVGVGVARQTA